MARLMRLRRSCRLRAEASSSVVASESRAASSAASAGVSSKSMRLERGVGFPIFGDGLKELYEAYPFGRFEVNHGVRIGRGHRG